MDYRLAPETDYTGSIEDNYAGLKWLHANAASIGADPARIAVMGESAGGGHAALLAIAARDLSGLPPAFIGVGSIDLFHDEDVDYAQRLNAAGVSTQLIVVPGAFHGFDIFTQFAPNLRLVEWFNRAKTDALRRGLGLPA